MTVLLVQATTRKNETHHCLCICLLFVVCFELYCVLRRKFRKMRIWRERKVFFNRAFARYDYSFLLLTKISILSRDHSNVHNGHLRQWILVSLAIDKTT